MFLLDTNVFIEAKNDYYDFSVAPGFWAWLTETHEQGEIASVAAVRSELLRQEDELADWVRTSPASFWLKEDDATATALRDVATWAMDSSLQYRPAARTEFLRVADFRLVGAGVAGQHTIVTRERPAPNSMKRILLPDACDACDAQRVAFISPFELYRGLGLRLVQA